MIDLYELSVERNLIISDGNSCGDYPGLSKLPEDYEKRFFVLVMNREISEDSNELRFLTQEEVDYWISEKWVSKEDMILGKL